MGTIPSQATHVQKNEAHVAGHLAKDPELRHTSSGKAVASLTIATKYKDSTEYHRVTCWEQLAEKVKTLKKGEFVRIVGRLQTHSWDDKKSGQKKYSTEIIAWQVVIPDKETVTKNAHGVEVSDADIPF